MKEPSELSEIFCTLYLAFYFSLFQFDKLVGNLVHCMISGFLFFHIIICSWKQIRISKPTLFI